MSDDVFANTCSLAGTSVHGPRGLGGVDDAHHRCGRMEVTKLTCPGVDVSRLLSTGFRRRLHDSLSKKKKSQCSTKMRCARLSLEMAEVWLLKEDDRPEIFAVRCGIISFFLETEQGLDTLRTSLYSEHSPLWSAGTWYSQENSIFDSCIWT